MMVRGSFIFVKRGCVLGAKWTSAVFRDKGQSRLNVLKKKKKKYQSIKSVSTNAVQSQ